MVHECLHVFPHKFCIEIGAKFFWDKANVRTEAFEDRKDVTEGSKTVHKFEPSCLINEIEGITISFNGGCRPIQDVTMDQVAEVLW